MYFDRTVMRETKCVDVTAAHTSKRDEMLQSNEPALLRVQNVSTAVNKFTQTGHTNSSIYPNVTPSLLLLVRTMFELRLFLHTFSIYMFVWLESGPTSSWHICPVQNLWHIQQHICEIAHTGPRSLRVWDESTRSVNLMNIVINPSCIDVKIDKQEIHRLLECGSKRL